MRLSELGLRRHSKEKVIDWPRDTTGIKQKGDIKCIPWKNLKDLILTHPDAKKKVDVFALSIYGLVVFSKALGHVDEVVTDLFDRLDKRVTPVSVIFAETFRSLNASWRAGEGRFIGCAQLLLAWFHSHFWKVDKVSYRVFSESYSPLKKILLLDEILYQCGDFDWVPLLGIWGAIGYAPLLVLRQYRSRQFLPVTQGLTECEFSYRGDGYKKKIREMASAWNQTRRMKGLAIGPMTTSEYSEWWDFERKKYKIREENRANRERKGEFENGYGCSEARG
ncbi:hypothetical protein Gotur_032420 [Gossypium turneri]